MPAPVIEARNLSRRFGRRWALARLDLELQAGERLLVLGANGSGKSTLLGLLSTLLPPTLGELRLFGLSAATQARQIRARSHWLRHAHGMYEDLGGVENLQVRAAMLGRRIDPRAELRRVGLDERPEPIRTWSAGMRKRLQIAMMLVEAPELALIDEPFSALDPQGAREVERLIDALPGAVVLVSHQLERASALCGRALLLEGGLPRWEGPAHQAPAAWARSQRAR